MLKINNLLRWLIKAFLLVYFKSDLGDIGVWRLKMSAKSFVMLKHKGRLVRLIFGPLQVKSTHKIIVSACLPIALSAGTGVQSHAVIEVYKG